MRLFLIFSFLLFQVNGFKYLLYNPKSTRSHVLFVNKIADVLIEGGHEVVILMPELEKNFGSAFNHKKARIIEHNLDYEPEISVQTPFENEWEIDEHFTTIWNKMIKIFQQFALSCDYLLKNEKLLEALRKEKFDLAMGEFFDPCGFSIFEKIGVKKTITLYSTTSAPVNGILGIPSPASSVPSFNVFEMPPLSFMSRVKTQIFTTFGLPFMYWKVFGPIETVFQQNGVDVSLYDMLTNSSYWFVNTDELVDFSGPISHKIINIAGVGLQKVVKRSGQLDKKFNSIFDNSKQGVFVISFGSVAKSVHMPKHIKQAFVDAIKEFPDVNFIWKYEKPDDNSIPKLPNLFLEKWLPQTDLFAQEKLIAFVSHAGGNSMTEATYFGVPVICIPMFTDQPRNALVMKYRKMALSVHKSNITKDSLVEAFSTIIHDKSYRQNAKALAQMMAEKPMSVDERVLKYTEFATKFDVANQLDMPGRSLNFVKFYNLDVWAFLLFVFLVVLYVLYRLIKPIFCFVIRLLIGEDNRKKSKAE